MGDAALLGVGSSPSSLNNCNTSGEMVDVVDDDEEGRAKLLGDVGGRRANPSAAIDVGEGGG
jgi:hypothetical protein